MRKEFKILSWVAVAAVFLIGIGYGISLVSLDNQERVSKIVHQGKAEAPYIDINKKLKNDLANAKMLLMVIEDRKLEGKPYSASEEKEQQQFVADLQAVLEKR
ncbi:MAG: hypothetical protein WC848_02700 [Parcubacteria group bacterium]|jgi:hypothetical protein